MLTFLALNALPRVYLGDLGAIPYTALSLLREGNFDLNEFPKFEEAQDYRTMVIRGRRVTFFPLLPAVQILPIIAWSEWRGTLSERRLSRTLPSLAARLFLVGTLLLLGSTVERRYGPWIAGIVLVGYGWGTMNFPSLGRELTTNMIVQFWLAAACWLLWGRSSISAGRSAAALACLALLPLHRPVLAPVAVSLGGLVLLRTPRWRIAALVPALGVTAAVTALNYFYFEHPLGGYGLMSSMISVQSPSRWAALCGNLLSPGRGLLLLSPWVVFPLLAPLFRAWWSGMVEERLAWLLWVLHWVAVSHHNHWWAGHSTGPRFLSDLFPLLALLFAEGLRRVPAGSAVQRALLLCVGVSVLINVSLVTVRATWWSAKPVDVDLVPERLWDWRDPLALASLRARDELRGAYPLQVSQPPVELVLSEPRLVFEWTAWPGAEVSYQIEVITRTSERARKQTWTPRQAGTSFVLDFTPETWAQSAQYGEFAWRVRAVDGAGRVLGYSGWGRVEFAGEEWPR